MAEAIVSVAVGVVALAVVAIIACTAVMFCIATGIVVVEVCRAIRSK